MRRHVAILGSFVFLAVASLGTATFAQASVPHPACSMLTVYAHAGELAFNFCISVIRTSPTASTISGIRIYSPGLENEVKTLSSLNNGFSPIPGGDNILQFKGENVSADAGGKVLIKYTKPDGSKASTTMTFEPKNGGGWVTLDNKGPVNLADIEMGTGAVLSIKSIALSQDDDIPKR